jgi:sacsin
MIRRLYKRWHPDKNVGNESVACEIFKFIRQLVLKLENGENIDNDDKPDTFAPQRNPHSQFWSHFETWNHDARTDFSHQQERTNSTKCNASTRGYRNESVPSHAEARQWMKQAKLDLKAALEFLPSAKNGPTFNWICYMCYQVYICFTDKGYCGRDHMITVFTFTFQ